MGNSIKKGSEKIRFAKKFDFQKILNEPKIYPSVEYVFKNETKRDLKIFKNLSKISVKTLICVISKQKNEAILMKGNRISLISYYLTEKLKLYEQIKIKNFIKTDTKPFKVDILKSIISLKKILK